MRVNGGIIYLTVIHLKIIFRTYEFEPRLIACVGLDFLREHNVNVMMYHKYLLCVNLKVIERKLDSFVIMIYLYAERG